MGALGESHYYWLSDDGVTDLNCPAYLSPSDMTPLPDVTRDGGPPIVHVRPWFWFWLAVCTCGQYQRHHLRRGHAMREAEIHEITHLLPT